MSILTPDNIYKLDRGHVYQLVRARDAIDYKKRVVVENKCRTYCANHVPGWQRRVLEIQNAVIRTIRKDGPFDSRDFMAAMAAAEEAAMAEICVDQLNDQEHAMLWNPLASVLRQVADAPEAKNVWTAPVGASETPQEPQEDLFGFLDEGGDSVPPEPAQPSEQPYQPSPAALDAMLANQEEKRPRGRYDADVVQDPETGAYFVGQLPPVTPPAADNDAEEEEFNWLLPT